MPLLLMAAILAFIMLTPTVVLGFVGGVGKPLRALPIGDFGCVLEEHAAEAWLQMVASAAEDGVILKPKGPLSAFRTHEQQGEMVAELPTFAAAVDHSPHQAGIAVDVDLTQLGNPLEWLQLYAELFSWQPLPTQAARAKEPWHWEYHGNVA